MAGMEIETVRVGCPYCGETIEIDVEPLEEIQTLIEDCSVCCRPIQFKIMPGDDGLEVTASRSA
jgi:hypothetical protein